METPLSRARWLQETRKMRFEEAYTGWQQGRLSQAEAARLLGVCERTLRRQIDRYESDRYRRDEVPRRGTRDEVPYTRRGTTRRGTTRRGTHDEVPGLALSHSLIYYQPNDTTNKNRTFRRPIPRHLPRRRA